MTQISKALEPGRPRWVPSQAVSMMHILYNHNADSSQVR